ncbi:hypothetical protein MVES_000349 [Malassezia vespertilionis]|uniref:Uncharacterized protein n=1 Tax=Malassezia vespertilionis TaxID=2020962 RepID=A0A2N1JHB7_9BASI|nr:hypothetical protein MVES_000349 [Malassezia vespertilionis]
MQRLGKKKAQPILLTNEHSAWLSLRYRLQEVLAKSPVLPQPMRPTILYASQGRRQTRKRSNFLALLSNAWKKQADVREFVL